MEMKIKRVAFTRRREMKIFLAFVGTRLLHLIVCFFFRGEKTLVLSFLSFEGKQGGKKERVRIS